MVEVGGGLRWDRVWENLFGVVMIRDDVSYDERG